MYTQTSDPVLRMSLSDTIRNLNFLLHVNVLNQVPDRVNNNRCLWGVGGGECKSVVLQGNCCVPAVAVAEASAGWGGGGGGRKIKIAGVWSWGE